MAKKLDKETYERLEKFVGKKYKIIKHSTDHIEIVDIVDKDLEKFINKLKTK